MDDKHALHVDEVHMKPTMPDPKNFSLNFNRISEMVRLKGLPMHKWIRGINRSTLESHDAGSALWLWTQASTMSTNLQVGRHRRSLIIDQDLEAGTRNWDQNATSSQRSDPSSSHKSHASTTLPWSSHPAVAHDIKQCDVIAENNQQGIATTNNIYRWRRFCLTV